LSQEKVPELVGIDRTTISKIEKKNVSNVKNHNTYIPDLRYKIPKGVEEEIAERAEKYQNTRELEFP